MDKVQVSMGDNSFKIVESKFQNHMHIFISTTISSEQLKDVGGVEETRSRSDGRKDERNNAHTDGRGSFL